MGILAVSIPLWLAMSYGWYRFTAYQAKKELAEKESYEEESVKSEFLIKNVIGVIVMFILSLAIILLWQLFLVIGIIAAALLGFVALLMHRWSKSVKADKKDK